MTHKLYLRIWLAVVLTVAVLMLLVGWIWRLAAEPPLRDVVIRNEAGQVVGRGRPRGMAGEWEALPGGRWVGEGRGRRMAPASAPTPDADQVNAAPERPGAEPERPAAGEFTLRMHDGQTMRMHLMRAPASVWSRPPFGFAWMLVWVGIAVALATYPIVRTLTRRLERVQQGVQQWGEGDLSVRVAESGSDEVAFLAKRFNQAAERVQSLVQSHEALLASQKSLLANASHELRSPLARIRMGLELLGPGAAPEFKAEIARNIAELDLLIEEILLASRLDARQADMGTVEAVDLVGLAAEECARVGAELEVHASEGDDSGASSTGFTVQGVSKLLRRAIRNLLENARRHAAGDITLTLAMAGPWLEVRVCDHGPGVPEALQERVFEPFYRLPGATERDGGVGLGLALVKSIAERHGGHVQCQNRPGGGACFIFQLPHPAT